MVVLGQGLCIKPTSFTSALRNLNSLMKLVAYYSKQYILNEWKIIFSGREKHVLLSFERKWCCISSLNSERSRQQTEWLLCKMSHAATNILYIMWRPLHCTRCPFPLAGSVPLFRFPVWSGGSSGLMSYTWARCGSGLYKHSFSSPQEKTPSPLQTAAFWLLLLGFSYSLSFVIKYCYSVDPSSVSHLVGEK